MTTIRPKILVIAAEPADRELVSRALVGDQYEVLQLESVTDAVDQLDSPIDLVLCDLCTRDHSCQDLMQQWHDRRPTTPFILMAGADDVIDAIESMKHGAADYVTKPVNAEELVVRITKWLDASRKDERLQQLESRLDVGRSVDHHYGSGIDIPAGTSLEDLERAAVEKALAQHHGNRTHAAKTLGISVRTLQRKLRAWRVPVFAMQHHSSINDFSMHYAQ